MPVCASTKLNTKPLMQLLEVKPANVTITAEKLREQKSAEFTLSPYNMGGFFLKDNYKSYRQFVIYMLAATFDLTGVYALIELQQDIQQKQPADISAFLELAPQRNPYNHEVMDYNPASGDLGFTCLNKRDNCNIYLDVSNSTDSIAYEKNRHSPNEVNETVY